MYCTSSFEFDMWIKWCYPIDIPKWKYKSNWNIILYDLNLPCNKMKEEKWDGDYNLQRSPILDEERQNWKG